MAERLVAFVVCDGVTIDALSGRPTLFGVLESISAPKYPAVLARLCMLCTYEREEIGEPRHFQHRCRIVSPDNREVDQTHPATIHMTERAYHAIHQIRGVRLEVPGAYRVISERSLPGSDVWEMDLTRIVDANLSKGAGPTEVHFVPAGSPKSEQTPH